MQTVNAAVQAFFGPATKHVSALAAVSPTFADEVITHPTYRAVCDAVLLPSCSRYRLNLGHLIVRGPGAAAQFPHRDEDVWPHFPRPHADIQVASMVALGPFRVDNGATCVVPGSHRWPRDRQAQPDEIVHAELPAGGAVVYLGSTIHFAGSNSTADEWRRGAHVSFTLGWLRTEENNFLAVPPSVARRLSPAAQELIGYAVHDAIADGGGYLGMVRMRDPMELLAEGALDD
jgi:ectoine hydroxylase-related dioxygenase (phytanoyl-CoA dioxygenase family)